MLKFLGKIFLFFMIIVLIDQIAGVCLDYMYSHQKGNFTKDLYYVLYQSKEDVLVFGSSRAMNHYVPSVIEDSIHLSAYNCGYAGEGAVFHAGRIRHILNRYSPKLIIYDVEPRYDIGESPNERFLDRLKPNANDSCISNYFKEFSFNEYLKSYSRLYCYNALFYDVLKGFVSESDLSLKGYRPLYGSNVNNSVSAEYVETIDSVKLKALESIIKICKHHDTKILFISSPRYGWVSSKELIPVKTICEKYNVPFYDFYSNNDMTHKEKLYYTSGHLNDDGDRYYTTRIIPYIRSVIQME